MTCPLELKRHFLHANFLEFVSLRELAQLEVDLPEDLAEVLKDCGKINLC